MLLMMTMPWILPRKLEINLPIEGLHVHARLPRDLPRDHPLLVPTQVHPHQGHAHGRIPARSHHQRKGALPREAIHDLGQGNMVMGNGPHKVNIGFSPQTYCFPLLLSFISMWTVMGKGSIGKWPRLGRRYINQD